MTPKKALRTAAFRTAVAATVYILFAIFGGDGDARDPASALFIVALVLLLAARDIRDD